MLSCRAAELQFYTSTAAVAMLVPAWIFFMVSLTITVTFKGVSLALCGCHAPEGA